MGLDMMTFQIYGIRSNKSQYSRVHDRIVIDVTVYISDSRLKNRKFLCKNAPASVHESLFTG